MEKSNPEIVRFVPKADMEGEALIKAEIDYYVEQLKKIEPLFNLKRQEEFIVMAMHAKKQQEKIKLFDIAQDFLQRMKATPHGRRRFKGTGEPEQVADVIERHVMDRVVAKKTDFKEIGKKPSGATGGYLGIKLKDPEDQTVFMIKKFIRSDLTPDFIKEMLTAPFYKRTLYDRTPIIEGVKSDDPSEILIRSKYLHDFQPVSDYKTTSKTNELKSVKGVAKVFAAILAWGEADINIGNLGVMKTKEGELVLAKIDHGASATYFFTTPSIALEKFAENYEDHDYNIFFSLNIDELKEALNQLTSISKDEIEQIVQERAKVLKEMGLDISELALTYYKDGEEKEYKTSKEEPKPFEALAKHYTALYIKQIEVLEQVRERLDIISKIDVGIDERDAWENGGWLTSIRGKDPIVWAEENDKKIEDQDPIVWAVINGKKIEDQDPIAWAVINGKKIEDLDPIAWAAKNGKKIEGLKPAIWLERYAELFDGLFGELQLSNKRMLKKATLSTEDTKSVRKWCENMLHICSSSARAKIDLLQRNLDNFEKSSDPTKQELGSKILEEWQSFLSDPFFTSNTLVKPHTHFTNKRQTLAI